MQIALKPGKYVLAVSGGVDSVVLLDILAKQKNVELVVAHFDHGMRKDSNSDKEFVAKLSRDYGLPFEYGEGRLNKNSSEDEAREQRYEFLQNIRKKYQADAVITAHHKDDVLETVVFNVLRGTGRRGLSSLGNHKHLIRPLLDYSKAEIIDYANSKKLIWREDSTNANTDYTRNWIRAKVIPKLSSEEREGLLNLHQDMKILNKEADEHATFHLESMLAGDSILKKQFNVLPHSISCELIATWLRANKIRDFDKKLIERVVVGSKTLTKGKRIDLQNKAYVLVENDAIKLVK